MSWVMEQDYETGLKLIIKARDERDEARRWQLYCSIFPNFTKENFIPWEQFVKKGNEKVSMKPKEQIHKETNKLKQLFARKQA